MSTGPHNAFTGSSGVRMYSWVDAVTGEETQVLSVTSIRRLCGLPMNLVNWQIRNVVNLAMGTRMGTRIGPRGGVYKILVTDGEFPGEFVRRLVETEGQQGKLDDVKKWLTDTADHPRDIAAVRGTVVHKLIEQNIAWDRLTTDYTRQRIVDQWQEERRKTKPAVTDDDVSFVINAMRQYWDMRAHVRFVTVARESQVWNLSAGYAGSPDAVIWFLPDGASDKDVLHWQTIATKKQLTLDMIETVGGHLAVGDWKTAEGLYTDNVVQVTAYGGAEFVGADGVRDERLTEILSATDKGLLFHVRPDGWGVHEFPFEQRVMYAFLGSVAFARFLAMHERPTELFTDNITGKAPGTEEATDVA